MAGAWPRCSKRAREVSPERMRLFLPFSPCGRWCRSEAEADEGSASAERTPHPALRATFSHKGRRRKPLFLLDATRFHELRPLLLILVDEGGIVFRRAWR